MTKDALILLWCVILAALAGFAAVLLQPSATGSAAQTTPAPKPVSAIVLEPEVLQARAAVLLDAKTGTVLFEKNAQLQMPLASLTKLATALAALSEGEDKQIVIRASDLSPEGDSGLHVGDVWRLSDLVAFSLTSSSNDGMEAASRVLTQEGTISSMNAAAAAAGLEQSYFLNPTGLDLSSSTAGAYGSALDVAHLAEELLKKHGEVFKATTRPPVPNGKSGKGATSTLEPLWDLPGLIAAKTGYTDLAGGNLVAVVDLGVNQPVVAVVLGSTINGRFDDARILIAAARKAQITETHQ